MKSKILRLFMVAMATGMVLLAACSKDDPKHSECDILSAWVEGAEYESYFYNASQMRVENISSSTNEVTFIVRSVSNLPTMPVWFTLSAGASISPANGSAQDFSNGPVTYVVTAEDGEWSRRYTVAFRESYSASSLFSFEHVDTVKSDYSSTTYHRFYELDAEGSPRYIWASGNEGVALVNTSYLPSDYPTRSVDGGYSGRGVCLTTQDAGAMGRMFNKPIAAGNLYLGRFNVEQVLTNPLLSTEFGIPVDQQPIKVSGYYKYQPGAEFTNASSQVVDGRVDEADIYALFYRNRDESGNEVVVTGEDLETNPYIISRATVSSLPATDQWTRFEMTFEGDAADAELLTSQGYNMTIVFSSSKNGAAFEGAIGSTLYVDEVEVTYASAE